jgi:NAD(P)-dependent dehydrogenase (short-subunit alcohol dehydrogenase family)
MKGIIVITGASSGFGRLTAEALALDGHTVYAAMRETAGRNAPQVQAVKDFSAQHKADLRAIELDVGNQGSVDAAIETIIKADGHIDTVVHNAGHMVFGPAEAFTPEQFAELYDINVLSTQRVNRAVLPHMRERHELSLWGIETSIIVPGAFTKGTNHFAHSGRPADLARAAAYEAGPYAGYGDKIQEAFGRIVPDDADASGVARAIVEVVNAPFGKRPFRVHYDPTKDGAEVAFAVIDRVRDEMLHRVGMGDLLRARGPASA